jgi:hypothetical protein
VKLNEEDERIVDGMVARHWGKLPVKRLLKRKKDLTPYAPCIYCLRMIRTRDIIIWAGLAFAWGFCIGVVL